MNDRKCWARVVSACLAAVVLGISSGAQSARADDALEERLRQLEDLVRQQGDLLKQQQRTIESQNRRLEEQERRPGMDAGADQDKPVPVGRDVVVPVDVPSGADEDAIAAAAAAAVAAESAV